MASAWLNGCDFSEVEGTRVGVEYMKARVK